MRRTHTHTQDEKKREREEKTNTQIDWKRDKTYANQLNFMCVFGLCVTKQIHENWQRAKMKLELMLSSVR